MGKSLAQKTKEGVAWNALFGIGRWIFRFASSVILARLLFPTDFGVMGAVTVVINFTKRMSSFGFNLVLVQKKEINDDHKDAVFYFNLFLESLLALIIIALAAYLADFFHNQAVEKILYVMSIVFILDALGSVPKALLQRKMKFKQFGIVQLMNTITGLIVPIGLALLGFGVWSLVWGRILGSIFGVIIVFYYARWIPRLSFKFRALKEMFAFGFWVYANNLINYTQNNIDYFLIGRLLGVGALGFYERAFNLMNLPRRQIAHIINSVLFSAYSKIQDQNEKIIRTLKRVQTSISFVGYPIMIWLFFAAPSFITVLYGPKWTPTIAPLQIMCISGLINTLTMTFFPVILAKGLVAQRAILQGIYLVILSVLIIISTKLGFGIVGVAWSVVIGSVIYLLFILWLMWKYLNYSPATFVRAQRSAFVYGSIQLVALLVVVNILKGSIPVESASMFVIVSAVSILVYFSSHLLIGFQDVQEFFEEIVGDVKKLFHKFTGKSARVAVSQKVSGRENS